jgi:hypothetical protein
MKAVYRIIRYCTLPTAQLRPHPAAELPIDHEGSTAMTSSVKEHGVIHQPLLVMLDGDRASILDGVNRWKSAMECNLPELPCLIVECDNPRAVALDCLASRRACSTGQRVLAFIEGHKTKVLTVADQFASFQPQNASRDTRSGHVTGSAIAGDLKEFTAEAIADRLGCSDKDVRAGIELFQACEKAEDTEFRERARQQKLVVFAGASPIRRWKAALAGRASPQKGRSDTDHADLALRTFTSLKTVFTGWKKIDPRCRAMLEEMWTNEIAPILPDTLK